MEPFARAVDRLLANQAINPSQIAARASGDLASRGIRQPGGLLNRTTENYILDALQIIYDTAAEERSRRKDADADVLRDEVTAYLSAKFEPLRAYAASLASGRPSSIKSLANAQADKFLQQAASN